MPTSDKSSEPSQSSQGSSSTEAKIPDSELLIPASLVKSEPALSFEAIQTLANEQPEKVLEVWDGDRKRVSDFYSKKEDYRHQESVASETTKRVGMGLIFAALLSVLVYAGVTADKTSFDRILTAALAAFGGAGAVATFSSKSKQRED